MINPVRLKGYLLLPLLISTVITTYSNSIFNPFHFDDFHSIVENPYIRYVGNIPLFFKSPEMFSGEVGASMYRPILLTTYAINYWIGGYSVFGYHIVNILLHTLNAILLYFILTTLLTTPGFQPYNRWFAFLGALLFGLHTINTQAVNYISSRSVLLVTLFYLSSLLPSFIFSPFTIS